MSSSDCNLLVFGPVPATRPLFPDNDTAVPVPRREEVDTQDEEQSCKNTDAFRLSFPPRPAAPTFEPPVRRRRTTTTTVAREKERKKGTTRARSSLERRKKERKKEESRCFICICICICICFPCIFFFCKKLSKVFVSKKNSKPFLSLSLTSSLSFGTRRREHARSREDKERERETTRARARARADAERERACSSLMRHGEDVSKIVLLLSLKNAEIHRRARTRAD